MSNTTASLRRKIGSASDLESVVRTMKAMAASGISQYENAVRSLEGYDRAVQLGLGVCFQQRQSSGSMVDEGKREDRTGVVIFGSDQGLVGQFNDLLADFVINTLAQMPGEKVIWVVGERIQARLAEAHLDAGASFALPNSIAAITPLVGQLLFEMEKQRERGGVGQVHLFHNRPGPGAIYEQVTLRMLPLDEAWKREWARMGWPSKRLPEVMPVTEQTLLACVREYLFVSLFRACAESLASENACRLAAMQRAEKNIGELLDALGSDFHRLRQSTIDEELFDLVSGFEAYTR